MEFSPALGLKYKKKMSFKENINVFNDELPSTQLMDFTEGFKLKSPVQAILSEINLQENETKQK